MDLSQSLVPAQSDKDVEKAKFKLKVRVENLRECKVRITSGGRPWDKESCKKTLKIMRCASSSLNLEQWYKEEYESKLQKDVPLNLELVDLIKKAYGTDLCWCLANFPDLEWFINVRRKKAYAELLEAVIELGNDAQSAAPTTKFPAPHDRPTQHLPSTLVAVEETPNQHRHEETIGTDGNPGSLQPLRIATACSEGQASSGPPSPSGTSSSKHTKRRLEDREDESGSWHCGTDVSGDQTLQHPKAKRARRAPNTAAELISEDLSMSTLPRDDGNTIVVSPSQEVVQVQHAISSNSSYPIETPTQYYPMVGTILVEFLTSMPLPSMSQKPKVYNWNTVSALDFLTEAFGPGGHPGHSYDTYSVFDISIFSPVVLYQLVVHMPQIGVWITGIQKSGKTPKIERMVLAIPHDIMAVDSLLIVSAP